MFGVDKRRGFATFEAQLGSVGGTLIIYLAYHCLFLGLTIPFPLAGHFEPSFVITAFKWFRKG